MKQQPYIIVLAGNTREGRRYAKLAGLPKGRHRVVYSAKQIRHLRSAEVHELPSFKRRPDRHAINAALRYTRGERRSVEMPADVVTDPRGPLTARQLEVAYRFNALRGIAALDAVAEEYKTEIETATIAELDKLEPNESDEAAREVESRAVFTPVPDEGRKRRSRCRVCDELVFSDNDPAHDAAKHEATDSKVLGKPVPTTVTNFFGQAD